MTMMNSEPFEVTPTGDAEILLTGPVRLDRDPLRAHPDADLQVELGQHLGRHFVAQESSASKLLQGTLTYAQQDLPSLSLDGTNSLLQEIESQVADGNGSFACKRVSLLVFPDGYGAVSVQMSISDGWKCSPKHMPLFSPEVRSRTAETIREVLSSGLHQTYRQIFPEHSSPGIDMPYFNITYLGETRHRQPGLGYLKDDLRTLIYPEHAGPLTSSSPHNTEYFYAGYAYLMLFGARVTETLREYELLLQAIGVSYYRLSKLLEAARTALRANEVHDAEFLAEIASRLRADYNSLVSPIFSYDHHYLLMRNEIFRAWDINTLNLTCQSLLSTVRERAEVQANERQRRRDRVIQGGLGLISALSVIEAVDAILELLDRFSS